MNKQQIQNLLIIAAILIVLVPAVALELTSPGLLHEIAKGFQDGQCMAFARALCP